jgi:hypothetical protein
LKDRLKQHAKTDPGTKYEAQEAAKEAISYGKSD